MYNIDRARRKRRMEYMAACTIVRAFRYFTNTRLGDACMVIKDFLIITKNRNALTVASWAASSIAKWAKKTTIRWHYLRMQRITIAAAAAKKREEQQRIAAIELSSRQNVAKGAVLTALRQGMITIAKTEIGRRREVSRKEKASRKGWKKQSVSKPKAATSRSPSPSKNSSPTAGLAFLLLLPTTTPVNVMSVTTKDLIQLQR